MPLRPDPTGPKSTEALLFASCPRRTPLSSRNRAQLGLPPRGCSPPPAAAAAHHGPGCPSHRLLLAWQTLLESFPARPELHRAPPRPGRRPARILPGRRQPTTAPLLGHYRHFNRQLIQQSQARITEKNWTGNSVGRRFCGQFSKIVILQKYEAKRTGPEGRFSTRAGGRHPSSTSAPYAKEGRRLSSSAYRRPADHLLSLLVAPKIFNMGKKPGNAGPSSASRPADQAVSLREETSGKTQADVPSLLRIQHLQRLGAWASREAGVGSIGALLGHRLATNTEASGIPIGASTFLCQRCESILQPGFNCTIRIRNNKKKAKRHKKSNPGQNSVVYACHFCGDQNLIRGSGKGIVKGLLSSRKTVSTSIILKGDNINVPTVTTKKGIEHSLIAASQLESSRLKTSTLEKDKQGNGPKSNIHEDSEMEKGVVLSLVDCGQLAAACEDIPQKIDVEGAHDKCMNRIVPASCKNITICEPGVTSQAEFLVGSNFVTPMTNKLVEVTAPIGSAEPLKTRSTLKNKVQNCGSVAVKTPGSYSKSVSNTKSAPGDSAQPAGSSRKRSRKGWTTLKQIAEKEELERKEKLDNFVIPFFMQ